MRQFGPRTRLIIFFVGLPAIVLGSLGIARGDAWANVVSAVFTFFGTMMSFAQFSLGFTSLKPDKDSLQPAPILHSLLSIRAWLTSPTGQINLGQAHFAIGRHSDNQHVLDDSLVSDHHALIFPEGQDYALLDLGSTSGTWVNNQRLVPGTPQILRPGDSIRIGKAFFSYQMAAIPATPQAAGVPEQPVRPPSQVQSDAPLPRSLSMQTRQKRYVGSGIAFLITGISTFIHALFILFAPHSATLFTTDNLISDGIFGLVWVSGLYGIQGFYLKQEPRADWFAVIGTLMLAAGWLLNIVVTLVIIFLYASASPGKPIGPEVMQGISIFSNSYRIFLIAGDIILGIGVIRAAIYPSWTGFALSVGGVLQLIYFLGSFAGLGTNPAMLVVGGIVGPLLAAVVFCQWGVILIQSSHSSQAKESKDNEVLQR